MGIHIVVIMLDRTSPFKLQETAGYGGEVFLCGDDATDRQSVVERVAKERGMVAIARRKTEGLRSAMAPSVWRLSRITHPWKLC
jgi:threonine dehydratase